MKVIAESAFNHSGSLKYLKDLAIAAKESNADFFTAQVMDVDNFCVKEYSKYEIYTNAVFTKEEWYEVFDLCKSIDLDVIPCVLDETSFDYCYNYGYRLLKIHATDITNQPFLNYIKQKGDCRILLETQCATLFEINFAIELLGKENIDALFTGFSNYPTEVEELNLNAIDSLEKEYSIPTAYADHSTDVENVPLIVLAKGCRYLEKHITLSRNDRNYDWQVSLYPQQFKSMMASLDYYSKALGNGVKHPNNSELGFRDVMYKKVVPNSDVLKRADNGNYLIDEEISSFESDNVIVALIARLKSQRLPKKVMKVLHQYPMIVDLYKRVESTSKVKKTILATSDLNEDAPLVELAESYGLNVFTGHAVSVIDRMLELAYNEKASAIFRVTGDNPYTDPELMDKMINLYLKHDLDYVKVNNVPFGASPELFSTKYLWKLYLNMKNPMVSEYMTWFVLNDGEVKKGCIDVISSSENIDMVNLSVDYPEDFDRCKLLLDRIGKSDFNQINLKDLINNAGDIERVDGDKIIKLPEGESIKLRDYLDAFKNSEYFVREKLVLE